MLDVRSISAGCLVNQCWMFGQSVLDVWSISAGCLVNQCWMFGQSVLDVWSISATGATYKSKSTYHFHIIA